MTPTETVDYRSFSAASDQDAAAAMRVAKEAAEKAAASRIDLGSVTLTYGGLLVVNPTDRVVIADVAKAKVGDRVYVHEDPSVPDAVTMNGTACVPAAGKVRLKFRTPLIVAGGSLSITVHLVAFRPT